MTIRTPFNPVAVAALAAGAFDAPAEKREVSYGSFAFDIAPAMNDIRLPALPGWHEEYRETPKPAKKPVPGRVYH